jgi:hypothetical protein
MRVRKILLIAVIAVAAVAAARILGLWVGGQLFSSPTNATPTPVLVFAEEDLTFGSIPESEQVERELRITNTSAEPVTIERFETSCSCLGVEPTGPLTAQPGEIKALRIKLNASIPTGAQLTPDGLFVEDVTVGAVVSAGSNPQEERFFATLRYTVRQTVRFDPPVVQLGVVSHREPVQVKSTLILLPPIQDVRVLPHPEWVVTATSKGDHQREITAIPARPGIPRVVNDPVQLVPVGNDGKDRPERSLFIRGEIKQDIISTPNDIPLGRVTIGMTAEETFRLTSLTNRRFDVLKLSSEAADVAVSTDPSDAKLLTVRLTTKDRGAQVRWVSVLVKQDDGSNCEVRVPIKYHGE